MAMQEVLDSVRHIIQKWVNTITPITSNVTAGDSVINVQNVRRFQPGDQIMIIDTSTSVCETGLIIGEVDSDAQTITLTEGETVLNNWTVSPSTSVIKTIGNQVVQGIYVGDPDVIMRYPAITVNGVTRTSEWLTLESTTERYEIEIGVFVKDSTHEGGVRFLNYLVDTIQTGLKRNVIPMIYDVGVRMTSLKEDYAFGDPNIVVNNIEYFEPYHRIFMEDPYQYIETWTDVIYGDGETIKLKWPLALSFNASDTVVTVPDRFVYNSWPATINYGKIHKGDLLKAATISWFAEEQESQFLRRDEGRIY
jgi:hypothetical protein